MEQFPHLKFTGKLVGKPRIRGFGEPNPLTAANKNNRLGHSGFLSDKTTNIKRDWENDINNRNLDEFAPLNAEVVPIFIKINPELLNDPEFDLQKFGIEIVSENDEGFIVGASLDNLRALEEKIIGFITTTKGTAKIADFWEIVDGDRKEWKPQYILSEFLYNKWSKVEDNQLIKVEVGIAFDKPINEEPLRNTNRQERSWLRYQDDLRNRDDLFMQRETEFDNFISVYGRRVSSIIDLEDSFSCVVEITGKGLKDLVWNYQYVFEVIEVEEIGSVTSSQDFLVNGEVIQILPPNDNDPIVAVVDSGIMQNHILLNAAIDIANSKSYLVNDNSVADLVTGGGHGTRVAGAILYPNGITNVSSPYKLPCKIRNLRVLDNQCNLQEKYPADLMQTIVTENSDCKIFNLSINTRNYPYRKTHMSSWAAVIDTISHKEDKLFILSAGNLSFEQISHFINSGINYPDYLHQPLSKIANPSQSFFGITVGSINQTDFENADWKLIGRKDDVSAFSRIGTGIWNTIKPDVVEYGGGLVGSKLNPIIVNDNEATSSELVRSTLGGGIAYGRDATGTSFAAPKVANIAAQLQKLYPNESANLIRAFIVQGARLPNEYFQSPTSESMLQLGYGIPSLERVTTNTEHRITYYNTGRIKAEEGHVYTLRLPNELLRPENDFDILVEVTLAYTAKVRRTRQKLKSYLSTWLDWTSSKLGESKSDFEKYALKLTDEGGNEKDYDHTRNALTSIKWKLKEKTNIGVNLLSRNLSTVQKDWAVIKSNVLSNEISFVVRGHKGWDRTKEEVPYAITVSVEILGKNISIYNIIQIENEVEIEI